MTVAGLTTALSDRYRIDREIGSGGMATVYLARDLRHDRNVAIKVLRPELAAVIGAERFAAEIRTTANLQHPHLLPLFDSGTVDGTAFYVMPFVEGESLRARLQRERQLPVAEAVQVANEVADALQYAHSHGIIHRDIKPENILLHGGHALIADFGIALAASKSGSSRMTETGMSVGTPQYMAPEQAMGERELDGRVDIYAIGAVLYEMLVGEAPFTGPTAQAIVAKVLTETAPSARGKRASVPENVDEAIRVALEKMPADRFRTAAEFRAALSAPATTSRQWPSRQAAIRPQAGTRPSRRVAEYALAAAAIVVGAAFALRTRSTGAPPVFDIGFPDSAQMGFPSKMSEFSISPREDFVAYTVRGRDGTSIWRRDVANANAKPLTGTQGGLAPRVSPDGRFVAFATAQGIRIVQSDGGSARMLAELSDLVGLEWTSPRQLLIVDHDGNRARFFDTESGQLSDRATVYCIGPHWLDQAKQFLCGGGGRKVAYLTSGNADTTYITVRDGTSAKGTNAKGTQLAGSDFTLVDGRYLVYISLDGDLRAAEYDASSHTVDRPVTLVTGIRREPYTGAGQYRITTNGTLMYAPGPNAEVGRLVKLSRGKAPEPLPIEPAAFLRWDLTRDGKRLAAAVPVSDGNELRIYDLTNGRKTVWFRAHDVGQPLWSPSGDRLVIDVADSSGSAILVGSPQSGQPPDTVTRFTFAGRQVEPHHYPSEHVVELNIWDADVIETFDPTIKPFRADTIATGARFAAPSPDGRLLAYQSTKTGEIDVLDRATKRRVQVAASGSEPLWLSANQIVFRDTPGWYVATLDPRTGDVVGKLELWPIDPRFSDTPGYSNRLSADGGIIYEQAPEPTTAAYIRVVPHWVDAMKKRVRARDR